MQIQSSILFGILVTATNIEAAREYRVRGVTFSGGGFRAHSVHTGLSAGLSQVLSPTESNADKKLGNLFKKMEFLGSNSGGSWFSSHVVYSKNFVQLLDDIATTGTNAKAAGEIYNNNFTFKFLDESLIQSAQAFNPLFPYDTNDQNMSALAQAAGWVGILFDYLAIQPVEWTTFVENLLSAPGDLDPKQALSEAPVNTWAKKKKLAMAASLVLPSHDPHHASFGAFNKECIGTGDQEDARTVRYQNRHSNNGIGHALPITFSTHLATKLRHESPFPFMNVATNESIELEYAIFGPPTFFSMGKELFDVSAPKQKDLPGPGMSSHEISIGSAAASSSAFKSLDISIFQTYGILPDILADLDLWNVALGFVVQMATNTKVKPSKMFEVGSSLVTPDPKTSCTDWIQEIVENQVMTTSDGGYVGNTAIGNILASANDGDAFTLFLNTNGYTTDIVYLFGGPQVQNGTFTVPVFEESQAYAREQQAKFQKLDVIEDSEFLRNITYGTVDATTVDQPYFGIKGGIQVRLNVIIVDGDVGLAPRKWSDTGIFTGEISASIQMASNQDDVAMILKTFF